MRKFLLCSRISVFRLSMILIFILLVFFGGVLGRKNVNILSRVEFLVVISSGMLVGEILVYFSICGKKLYVRLEVI